MNSGGNSEKVYHAGDRDRPKMDSAALSYGVADDLGE